MTSTPSILCLVASLGLSISAWALEAAEPSTIREARRFFAALGLDFPETPEAAKALLEQDRSTLGGLSAWLFTRKKRSAHAADESAPADRRVLRTQQGSIVRFSLADPATWADQEALARWRVVSDGDLVAQSQKLYRLLERHLADLPADLSREMVRVVVASSTGFDDASVAVPSGGIILNRASLEALKQTAEVVARVQAESKGRRRRADKRIWKEVYREVTEPGRAGTDNRDPEFERRVWESALFYLEAHEFAHHLHGDTAPDQRISHKGSRERESAADKFAAQEAILQGFLPSGIVAHSMRDSAVIADNPRRKGSSHPPGWTRYAQIMLTMGEMQEQMNADQAADFASLPSPKAFRRQVFIKRAYNKFIRRTRD